MSVLFGPTSTTVRSNTRETPAAAVSSNGTYIELELSAENWPTAQAVNVAFLLSYNGTGGPWEVENAIDFVRPTPNPKTPGIQPPIKTGFGWGAVKPTHAKVRTINPVANFQTTVTVRDDT